ncbi:uncharacterized protein BXZ73DRAFT_100016 [Epithele typhae]|uniref:uncharacterized protein n=1 Tax=Epithele typhae TaxID=378194 RepID=UPI002008B1C4|nr:uncharacterized protein BXZ73DRAFT_100016 [Epithele typhae]KAH9937801.1 hypothetical protein BXZ73DRAFT_100016 [Epithele typhae]
MADPSASAAAEPQQLLQAIDDTYIANICTAAASAWLSYDIVLTLPEEVSLIWKAKWNLPKLMYFCVRYYTLLSLLFTLAVNTSHTLSTEPIFYTRTNVDHQPSCERWKWYNGFNGTFLSAVFGEAMFVMRLYAAYEGRKTMMVIITCLFLTELSVGIVTAALVVSSLRVTPRPENFPLPGCLFTSPKYTNLSVAVWAVAMSVTCVYFILILFKFAYSLSPQTSASSNAIAFWEMRRASPVVFLFLRDSAFYFFLVFIGNLLNLVFELIFAGRAIIPMGTVWLMVIYAVSAARLCLNTRGSLHHQQETRWTLAWATAAPEHDSDFSSRSVSSDRFVSGTAPPSEVELRTRSLRGDGPRFASASRTALSTFASDEREREGEGEGVRESGWPAKPSEVLPRR